ncbi:MAG: hypothetical protein ACRCWY_05110 [Cellulosilyticaceae bacterium]
MKIKCTDCGKKYKDMYMQCPHCGGIRREATVRTNVQEVIREEDLYGQYDKETETRSRYVPQKPKMTEEQGKLRPKLRIGLCVTIGVAIVLIRHLYTWGIESYREKMNPKEIQVQQLSVGDTLETPSAYVQVKGASVISDEWLANYIPEGYQIVGVELEGIEKEKRDESSYETSYYVSYQKDGETYYQPNLSDQRVVDSLRDQGYSPSDESYGFYMDEPVQAIFLVHENTKEITFNYTQLLYGKLRGFYKGVTYEIPLRIKEEK